jgi:hypothetical protein
MLFDDAVAHRKPEARAAAAGFGRKKRIEDAVNVFARDSGARIRNFNFNAAIVRARTHFEQAPTGHGVAGIQEKI